MSVIATYKCVCNTCEKNTSQKIVVATSKKKTRFILINESRQTVCKGVVDDCILNSKERDEKCDFIFELVNDKIAVFVECKGSDVSKAVDQIQSSINLLGRDFRGYTFAARIVTTKVYSADLRTEKYKRLRAKLGGRLETKNIECKMTI